MYKYGLFTASYVILIASVCEARRRKYDELEFWSRNPLFDRRYGSMQHYATKSRNYIINRHASRRLYDAKVMLEKFLGDLHDNRTSNIDFHSTTSSLNLTGYNESSLLTIRSMIDLVTNLSSNQVTNSTIRSSNDTVLKQENPEITQPQDKNKNKPQKHVQGPKHKKKDKLSTSLNPIKFRAVVDESILMTTTSSEITKRGAEKKKLVEEEEATEASEFKTPPIRMDKMNLSPYSIHAQLKDYVIPAYVDVNITTEVIGRTVEYNDIVLLKASYLSNKGFFRSEAKYSDDAPEKKVLFIVHGLSIMGYNDLPCMRTLASVRKLLSYYFNHLDHFNIYIIPMANPDGVSAAMSKAYWNKNMSPQSACPGVALDRNFDVAFNHSSSVGSCSQQYPGPFPFSEAESAAVREVFHRYSHKIVGYFHVHAGTYFANVFKGDAVLYPKGFTEVQTDDDKYVDLKGEIDEMMKNASFKVLSVTVESLYNWYGKVTGTSVDYASTVYGVPYAMEFVMQLYDDDMLVDDTEERETGSILTEVWRRIINTVFDNLYKSLSKDETNNNNNNYR